MKILSLIFVLFYLTALIMTIMFYMLKKNNPSLYVFSLMLLSITMIGYIITSIILVRSMFIKLRQFTLFIAGNTAGNKNLTEIERSSHTLIKLLTVLYTVALISSTIMLFVIIVFVMVSVIIGENSTGSGNGSLWRTNMVTYMFFSFSRLLFMIDSMINCLCLLLQINNARHLYPKLCFICTKFDCLKIY